MIKVCPTYHILPLPSRKQREYAAERHAPAVCIRFAKESRLFFKILLHLGKTLLTNSFYLY